MTRTISVEHQQCGGDVILEERYPQRSLSSAFHWLFRDYQLQALPFLIADEGRWIKTFCREVEAVQQEDQMDLKTVLSIRPFMGEQLEIFDHKPDKDMNGWIA